MNKRADIPTVVLVIGVLILCAVALVSFFTVSNRVSGNIQETTKMEELLSIKDQFLFYFSLYPEDSFEEIISKMSFNKEEFIFTKESEGYSISISSPGIELKHYFRV